jgi:hypothetical protein
MFICGKWSFAGNIEVTAPVSLYLNNEPRL